MTDPIASWQLVGGSKGDMPEDRFVPKHWFVDGWHTYVAEQIEPGRKWGCSRFILRNPHGTRTTNDPNHHQVEFTQYTQAERDTPWQVKGFVEAIEPVTYLSGTEICLYIGNPDDDPVIQDRSSASGKLALIHDNLYPGILAGCSFALDACVDKGPDSLSFAVATLLRKIGVKVYAEARPPKGATHWFDFPIICAQNFWHRSDPAKFPDSHIYASNEQLTGEIVQIVMRDPEDWTDATLGQWEKSRTMEVLTAGNTAAIPLDRILRHNDQNDITRRGLGQ